MKIRYARCDVYAVIPHSLEEPSLGAF
jgi:hypothetical protein